MQLKQKTCVLALLIWMPVIEVIAREVNSYALIADDATLTISNKRIRLYGVHIPATQESCQTVIPRSDAHRERLSPWISKFRDLCGATC